MNTPTAVLKLYSVNIIIVIKYVYCQCKRFVYLYLEM